MYYLLQLQVARVLCPLKGQVVWPNGVLASWAVGIAISLLKPSYKQTPFSRFTYDGNTSVMVDGSD